MPKNTGHPGVIINQGGYRVPRREEKTPRPLQVVGHLITGAAGVLLLSLIIWGIVEVWRAIV